jgi:hypothetical protein
MKKVRTGKMDAKGERISIGVVFMLAVAWLAFYGSGTAVADYSFYLDRFDVSGQVNVSDEFDDGVVAPWEIFDPTVVETGGRVSFSSPGTIESGVLDGVNYIVEMSFIGSEYLSPFDVENGAGDFTGISRWDAIVPGINQWYAMDVVYEVQQEPHIGISVSVGVANWDSDFAAIMGIEPGLGISFYRDEEDLLWRHILISEAQLTSADAILLKLDFYDDTDEFRAGFSLDNGVTYQYFPELLGWEQDTPGHYYWTFSGEAIELQAIEPLPVAIDIKPCGCPNPLNVNSKGVLAVAIVGTEDLDVAHIDPATVQLMLVDPLRWAYEDACTAYYPLVGKTSQYDCTEEGPDGFMDMTLKFDTQLIAQALDLIGGPLTDGEEILVTLTGNLLTEYGGIPIIGEDVIRIIKKGK